MLDLIFDGAFAFQQVMALIAALVCLALGGLLFGNWVYWRIRATRVSGTIVGVRQKDKFYYTVYSYMLPTGETFEATSDTGYGTMKGQETNRIVPLLVFPEEPLKVTPANSFVMSIVGLVLMAPGFFFLHMALFSYPVTWLTGVILAAFVLYGAMGFRKFIIPKEQRLAPEDWKAQRKAARRKEMESLPIRQMEDILATPEMTAELALQRKNSRLAAPFVLLFALGTMYGAYDLYNKMSALQVHGISASGTVVSLERSSSSSAGGGHVYYPVVTFADGKGNTVTFKDSFGSNPSLYKSGEKVTIRYLADRPEKTARIDHGFWDRLIPFIIGGLGMLLLLLFFKILA